MFTRWRGRGGPWLTHEFGAARVRWGGAEARSAEARGDGIALCRPRALGRDCAGRRYRTDIAARTPGSPKPPNRRAECRSAGLQESDPRLVLSEDLRRIRAEHLAPAACRRRAEVGGELEVAGVQVGQAGLLAENPPLTEWPATQYRSGRAVVGALVGVGGHPPAELGVDATTTFFAGPAAMCGWKPPTALATLADSVLLRALLVPWVSKPPRLTA